MREFPLLMVLATMLLTVLSAGVMLRALSSWVEHYATRGGAPQLGTGVRIVGVAFIGVGMALVLTTGIFLLAQRQNEVAATLGCAAAFVTVSYLVTAGGVCLYWGGQLTQADRMAAVERGTFAAYLLFWASGIFAAAIFVIWALEDPQVAGPKVFFSVFFLGMAFTVAALVDIIFAWSKGLERRHWNLWQMYLAIRSRRPLLEELEFLSENTWGRQRRRLIDICDEIQEGGETEDLFVRPGFLSATEGAQLSTGWKTGRLPDVLRGMLQRRMDFTRDLLMTQNPLIAVLYLWFLLLMFGLVTSFLMYWIVPKLKKIFDDFGTELPELTTRVISSSDAVANYWPLAFPGMLILAAAITLAGLLPFATGSPRFRQALSRLWPRICLPDILRGLALAAHPGCRSRKRWFRSCAGSSRFPCTPGWCGFRRPSAKATTAGPKWRKKNC